MKIAAEKLIEDLIERTKGTLNATEKLRKLSIDQLNWKANPESWSILECIEHLNLYGDFYLPEMENKMRDTKYKTSKPIFKSGLLGNYFSNSMLPKEDLNKMKTFKDKNPAGSTLTPSVLDKFLSQQMKTLSLLDKAREVDLNKTKTGITISSWIKLKLGDTFRVVIYHNQRHIIQANKALAAQG